MHNLGASKLGLPVDSIDEGYWDFSYCVVKLSGPGIKEKIVTQNKKYVISVFSQNTTSLSSFMEIGSAIML